MPVPNHVVLRELRKLHSRRYQDPVDEELRGWNWERPPVRPRAYLGLSVSEVATYCPTRRDTWLRRVARVAPEPSEALRVGLAVHEAIHATLRHLRRLLLEGAPWSSYEDLVREVLGSVNVPEGLSGWVTSFVRYTVVQAVAEASWSAVGDGVSPWLPWVSEVRVDGSPLGLSRGLRIDALTGSNVVVDFKVGKPCDNHKLMVAAYAMALEANLEVPVDYGIVVYVNGVNDSLSVRVEATYVATSLRKDFLDARDDTIDMLLTGREPPRAQSCSAACPFRSYC